MENMTVPGWVQHHQAYPAIEDYRKTVPWNLDFACSVLGKKTKKFCQMVMNAMIESNKNHPKTKNNRELLIINSYKNNGLVRKTIHLYSK